IHMHRAQVLLMLAASFASASDFSGASALAFAGRAVAFGPRPSGSEANRKLQAYIHAQLRPLGCQIVDDSFRASTPTGPVAMKNIVARFPGVAPGIIVVTGHYDTKILPGRNFVGANDGGSSTGLLIELARIAAHMSHEREIDVVFFDGEEAVAEWTGTDSVYGSRHLAARWAADGTLARIRAFINVDMIGDKDLDILSEENSSAPLRRLIWQAASDIGYGKYFLNTGGPVDDDHVPFLQRGVNAVDLIDFDYGPNEAYWHTGKDTMDKISAHSLQVVGDVLVETIKRLDR
ncbi:MAG: M28 family peptidase, partial [Bryobacteraceae bacterium]